MDPIHDDPAESTATGESAATAGAASAMRKDNTHVEGQAGTINYAAAGAAFTGWFNEKLHQLPNTQIRLGTKTANVVRLHPDGRLECSLATSAGESEQTFVAFEGQYLDQLVRKIGALGL